MSRPMNKAERAKHVPKMITGKEYEEITDYVKAFLKYHIFDSGYYKSQDFCERSIGLIWDWEHTKKHQVYTKAGIENKQIGIDLNGYK